MKKFLSVILLLAILSSFASCATQAPDDAYSPTDRESIDDSEREESRPQESVSSQTDSESGSPSDDKTDPGDSMSPSAGDTESPNEKVDLLAALTTLLSGYKWNPMSVIPEKMSPEYSGNLIPSASLDRNYLNFVSVNDIPKNGVGKQWNMVVENIAQSQIFFNVLSVIDNVSTMSVAAFNNYIDKNPADTAHYQFESGIYSVTISCTGKTIDYVLEYTANVPVLGEQSIQIALSMDTNTNVKNVRIQIGEANALAYTVADDKYTFAIKYLGVRRAYFEVNENSDGTMIGHIYEYITADAIEVVSAADFYITESYLTVVGNKADGIAGFEGAICELYSVSNGRMIGYEVMEKLEVSKVSVIYNTLWFDIEDLNGITSVKYAPKSDDNDENVFYINGCDTPWETKVMGLSAGLKKAGSRRFDIEFRTQYFYYYDSDNKCYVRAEARVPMLFIQEEVFDSMTSDINEKNNVMISVKTNSDELTRLKTEYAEKVTLLGKNKDKYTVEWIIEYIGSKKTFTD